MCREKGACFCISTEMEAPCLDLDNLYRDLCRRHEVLPNAAVLSWLSKAEDEKSCYGKYCIVILLDQLKNADLFPLIDLFLSVGSGEFERVDILHESPCLLNGELLMSLMRAIGEGLNIIDLQDLSFGEDLFCNLSQSGISCKVLNLWSVHIQKLNMVGTFSQLHTLNLDFCTSITSFHKDCFSNMPSLMRLSMCETRIANLWTTVAVLSNLPSLVELRFQKCPCCQDTGRCSSLYGEKANYLAREETNFKSSESELSSNLGRIVLKSSSGVCMGKSAQTKLKDEIQDRNDLQSSSLKKYVSHHPSPICYEKHYRQYMVVSLPRLEVLDNLPILKTEKITAKNVFSSYYEYLPYKWQHKESVVNILRDRETGTGSFYHPRSFKRKDSASKRKSHFFFPNALSAVKLGSSTWPMIEPVSRSRNLIKEESKRLRPRQFEYHPSNSGLMVFGTLDSEIVVVNHENGKVVYYLPSAGGDSSILGLCWLKKYPSKLIAGSDNGSLKLFDINSELPKVSDRSPKHEAMAFDYFEQLTSVHVNSTDEWFLASGYSRDLALYDIATGKRMELFTEMHREPINVAKFAHHSPFMFATSSFDHDVKMWDLRQKLVRPCYTASSSRGNVMVCFSHDDLYLLVSAVDNEVKQLLAVDGSLHTQFEIASTGSAYNYTRSYYMNGRDYIISGSCDEQVIRICCAQTGRRLRDVYLEDGDSGSSLFVQSLRGDPFRNFHLSVLASSRGPSSKCDIMKINLLASDHTVKEHHRCQSFRSSYIPDC